MAISSKNSVYQLKIALKGSKPPIWRRVLVKNNITLSTLDDIIQVVLGWDNCHLHMFDVYGENYGVPEPDFDFEEVCDETKYKLNRFNFREKGKFSYEYDFGDSWMHVITVEKILPVDSKMKYPVCIKGKNASPPEDCGGLWGYYNMLEVIANKKNPEREEYLEWLGEGFDPTHFDVDKANAKLGECE